jgi:hypothetical protein
LDTSPGASFDQQQTLVVLMPFAFASRVYDAWHGDFETTPANVSQVFIV